MITKRKNNGFTLLMTLLISTVVISVGLGIFNVVYRELFISTLGKDSYTAFFAASSGLECGYYWDLLGGIFADENHNPKLDPDPFICGSKIIDLSEENVIENGFEFSYYPNDTGPLATVQIIFPSSGELFRRKIISTGYSTDPNNPKVVERSIEFQY